MILLQSVEQEIKRLNAQSHEPTSAEILAVMQMLVDVLKKDEPEKAKVTQ
jgi:hypothetical protein